MPDLSVAVVAPGLRMPVVGYGGIERAAWDLAVELERRGHPTTVFGNVESGPGERGSAPGRVRILTEQDSLTHLPELASYSVVHDWSHLKPLRVGRLPRYVCTAMWTDVNAPGRTAYPSKAVRDAFKDPGGRLVPLGLPRPESRAEPADPPTYVVAGRIASYKGVDLALRIAERHLPEGSRLVVTGYSGPLCGPGEDYYALKVRRDCGRRGWAYVPNPSSLSEAIRGASGVLHVHRWLESFSLVVAEALMNGVPVLTTDVGAPQELVRETDGGFVVPLGPVERGDVSDPLIAKFFEQDWAARRAGIRKRACDQFSVDREAARYEKIYAAMGAG